MNGNAIANNRPSRGSQAVSVLIEAALIVLVGALLAFLANQVSPKGLSLSRNYFGGTNDSVPMPLLATPGPGTNAPSPAEELKRRLESDGLHWIDGAKAMELFRASQAEQSEIAFIDARGQKDYRDGHIPGAYQFDPYDKDYEKNIMAARQVCQVAGQVVVYCHGGDCDASVYAAGLLAGAGVPKEKLFVYLGGSAEWNSKNLPIEVGDRGSGNLRNSSK